MYTRVENIKQKKQTIKAFSLENKGLKCTQRSMKKFDLGLETNKKRFNVLLDWLIAFKRNIL